jgi:hypothetical protein
MAVAGAKAPDLDDKSEAFVDWYKKLDKVCASCKQ